MTCIWGAWHYLLILNLLVVKDGSVEKEKEVEKLMHACSCVDTRVRRRVWDRVPPDREKYNSELDVAMWGN